MVGRQLEHERQEQLGLDKTSVSSAQPHERRQMQAGHPASMETPRGVAG